MPLPSEHTQAPILTQWTVFVGHLGFQSITNQYERCCIYNVFLCYPSFDDFMVDFCNTYLFSICKSVLVVEKKILACKTKKENNIRMTFKNI